MLSEKVQHIVLVGPAYPFRGGIAHFTETMAHGLEKRGHRVTIVTFTRQYPRLLFPGKTQFEKSTTGDAVRAERLIDSVNPVNWWRTARAIAALRPDAVVFQHWLPFFAPAYGTIARYLRRRGHRLLAVLHNALPHERHPGDVSLSKYFLKACDGFIVLSDAVEADLRTMHGGATVRRLEHPVYDMFGEALSREEARERLGLPPEGQVLLFFGFVRRYKGLHVLLEAMPHVVKRLPDTRLVVAGEFYEDEQGYLEQIRRTGLTEHVVLHPHYIPKEDVAAHFSAADVIVQPYVSATQSGVVQIAYHFDRPVIVTDVGGLAEVVPHERAGLVVPPRDPEALAAAIIRFFEEHLGDELGEGVRVMKRRFSWDRLYDTLEELM